MTVIRNIQVSQKPDEALSMLEQYFMTSDDAPSSMGGKCRLTVQNEIERKFEIKRPFHCGFVLKGVIQGENDSEIIIRLSSPLWIVLTLINLWFLILFFLIRWDIQSFGIMLMVNILFLYGFIYDVKHFSKIIDDVFKEYTTRTQKPGVEATG